MDLLVVPVLLEKCDDAEEWARMSWEQSFLSLRQLQGTAMFFGEFCENTLAATPEKE